MTGTHPVASSPDAFSVIVPLRNSHERLRALAEPLDAEQLGQRSYASEWSIAQVLSHLGSGAENFNAMLDQGLRGEDPPGREAFAAVWAAWDARSPQEQATDALAFDAALVERLEGLDDSQRQAFHLSLFGRELDVAGFARMRLGEHAIHTWDVAVALDRTATVSPDAVDVLVDTLSPIAGHSGKPVGLPRRMRVVTSAPQRRFVLDVSESVALTSSDEEGLAEIRMPAEALVRLVYGRLDPDHTPPLQTDDVDLDELRAMFPGF
jgi:uncharacterized protein (TIGR03083 family)